jgi:hypothetical protein
LHYNDFRNPSDAGGNMAPVLHGDTAAFIFSRFILYWSRARFVVDVRRDASISQEKKP